jgi:hypothetical protein
MTRSLKFNALKSSVSFAAVGAALGVALIAGASAASAQTYISPQQVVTVPAATQVTTHTVRTVRPLPGRSQQVITTRTVTQRVLPGSTAVIAGAVAARPIYDQVTPVQDVLATAPGYSRPLYDYAGSGYNTSRPVYDYAGSGYNTSRPLYDEVVTRPAVPTVIDNGSILATQPYLYRYVYQSDRILVIDPATGEAIQSIPR